MIQLIQLIQLALLYPIYLIVNLCQMIAIGIHCFKGEIDGDGIKQRFAINLPKGKYDLWIHCSSLGEAKILSFFVQTLVKINPKLKFLISVQRNSAKNQIEQHLNCNYKLIYFPLDSKWLWRIFFKKIKVKNLICIESEIWPRLFSCKKQFGLKIFLINGRMSSDSYHFFKKLNWLFAPIFQAIDGVYAQNSRYCKHFNTLGVRVENLKDAGNIKYDLIDLANQENNSNYLQSNQELTAKEFIPNLCFVSTRKDEEKVIAEILPDLYDQFNQLRVFIAPRHPSRFEEVSQLFEKPDLKNTRAKKFSHVGVNHSLVIVDQLGELGVIYSASDLVVVGGTLKDYGGHSIIEPASFKKPILIGPFTDHITDDVDLFKKNQAIVQIQAKKKLTSKLKKTIIQLLNQPKERANLANQAFQLVQSQKGSSSNIANDLIGRIGLTGFNKKKNHPTALSHQSDKPNASDEYNESNQSN